jgi:hypothetical protein
MAHVYTDVFLSSPNEGFIREKDDSGNVVAAQEVLTDALERRTSIVKYRGAVHFVGTFRRPWVRDRFGGYHRSGVRPPRTKPTLADGSFSSGSVGNMIGYQTFVAKAGDVLLAESNPGPGSEILAAAGTGRAWSNLDWSPADSHVTHARGYVSVDGFFGALAWERPIQASGATVAENVGTAALGVTLPVRKAVTGEYQQDLYGRGVVPYTRWAVKHQDTVFYAGDPEHPERIYPSKLFEPEAVNSTAIFVNGRLDEPWLQTTDGLPVTGIAVQGDEVIVGSPRGVDRIQRYSYGDWAIHRINSYYNVVAHFSMRVAGPLDSLYFLSSHGPTVYNAGSFRFIGEKIDNWWRDWFRANRTLAADAFGVQDQYWGTYNLLLPQPDDSSLWLVVDCRSVEAGDPIWVFDHRARKDWVSEELAKASDANLYERYTGSCDGKVRQENVETDADDDGDAYQKKFTVQPKHAYMGDQGGDEAHGFTFGPLDVFLKHETNSATISLYAGEDGVAPYPATTGGVPTATAAAPHWQDTIAATQVSSGQRSRIAPTSEEHRTAEVSGKGVTLLVEASAPLGVEFRGWGIQFRKGPAGKQPFKA